VREKRRIKKDRLKKYENGENEQMSAGALISFWSCVAIAM